MCAKNVVFFDKSSQFVIVNKQKFDGICVGIADTSMSHNATRTNVEIGGRKGKWWEELRKRQKRVKKYVASSNIIQKYSTNCMANSYFVVVAILRTMPLICSIISDFIVVCILSEWPNIP